MTAENLLAIDIGTTNWKVVLFNTKGEILHKNSCKASVETDLHGTSYSANTLWSTISSLIKELVNSLSLEISAIVVTSMAEAGFPLNRQGETLYNAITWYDRRSIKQAHHIERIIGKEKLFQITGLEPNSVFTLSKILWIKENEPHVFNKIGKWLSIADFINFKLTGTLVTDYTLACRTQCFNIWNKSWSEEILTPFGINQDIFPDVVQAGTVIGHITPSSASQTGLKEGTPVVLGGHDQHCAFLAGGALLNTGTIFDSSGTVESIMTILPKEYNGPQSYSKMRIGNFIDPQYYVTIGGVIAAGGSVEWIIRQIMNKRINTQHEYNVIMDSIQELSIGTDGLFFLPHITGAGAPFWDPRSRGAFIGLRIEHTAKHLLHAVFEGLSFELAILLSEIEHSFGVVTNTLQTVGGGANNLFWQQLKANILNKTIHIPEVKETTSQGAALIAAVGIGIFENFKQGSKATYRLKTTIEPDVSIHEKYKKVFDLYKNLYEILAPIHHRIGELI
jgi:xylulokinase